MKQLRIGFIGLGARGMFLLKDCFCAMQDVAVTALCDPFADRLTQGASAVTEAGGKEPVQCTDYQELLALSQVDAVVIATGWQEHIPMAIAAMRAGKYVSMEVGGARTLEDCFALVKVHEETGVPLMMLENCCYDRRELMALHMVRQGLFGEVVHCAGGYMHDLIHGELFGRGDEHPHYRLEQYRTRNCESYPTHELGPIAKILDINRGNRMLSLTSTASKARGIHDHIVLHEPEHPLKDAVFAQGDIVTTVIRCENGETIVLTLDTTLPRPYYSRNFTVRGTRGMCSEERCVFFLDGQKEAPAGFNEQDFYATYDHPLYASGVNVPKKGHGEMDWLVCRAFVESALSGQEPPIDVYDAAAWMAITPLSEQSIANGSIPVEIPDFTGGKYKNRELKPNSPYAL